MSKINKHCLVVLSGGQDSITCLGMALGNYERVSAISFNYNQRHAVELDAAKGVCERHGVPHKLVDLGPLLSSLVASALTDPTADDKATSKPHPTKPGLPASFVPGRNALFLTLAHAHAQTIGAGLLMTGVCETDYSGYPDCRDAFIQALETALNLGYEANLQILTPLMHVDKAETFRIAEQWGFLEEVLDYSRTCYNGSDKKNEWGLGCGTCPACKLRIAGYEKFKKAEGTHPRLVSKEDGAKIKAAKKAKK